MLNWYLGSRGVSRRSFGELQTHPKLHSPVVNFTLPSLRTLQTRASSSVTLSHPCALLSLPSLPRSSPSPRPVLARPSSPGPPPPALARPSPGPRPALAHPRFKGSSRQSGQKRNSLQPGLSRSNDGHSHREGTNLGVFAPIWLVLPRREATKLGVFDLCHFNLLKQGCANSGGFGACCDSC